MSGFPRGRRWVRKPAMSGWATFGLATAAQREQSKRGVLKPRCAPIQKSSGFKTTDGPARVGYLTSAHPSQPPHQDTHGVCSLPGSRREFRGLPSGGEDRPLQWTTTRRIGRTAPQVGRGTNRVRRGRLWSGEDAHPVVASRRLGGMPLMLKCPP